MEEKETVETAGKWDRLYTVICSLPNVEEDKPHVSNVTKVRQRERERERERKIEREIDRQREREREKERKKERESAGI